MTSMPPADARPLVLEARAPRDADPGHRQMLRGMVIALAFIALIPVIAGIAKRNLLIPLGALPLVVVVASFFAAIFKSLPRGDPAVRIDLDRREVIFEHCWSPRQHFWPRPPEAEYACPLDDLRSVHDLAPLRPEIGFIIVTADGKAQVNGIWSNRDAMRTALRELCKDTSPSRLTDHPWVMSGILLVLGFAGAIALLALIVWLT